MVHTTRDHYQFPQTWQIPLRKVSMPYSVPMTTNAADCATYLSRPESWHRAEDRQRATESHTGACFLLGMLGIQRQASHTEAYLLLGVLPSR